MSLIDEIKKLLEEGGGYDVEVDSSTSEFRSPITWSADHAEAWMQRVKAMLFDCMLSLQVIDINVIEDEEDGTCCGNEVEPHTCPYMEDIDDDHETLCNCCSDCERNCSADI